MYSAIAFALLTIVASAQAKCDKGCDIPVKHYEELGCEPVYEKPEDCCPTHYDCTKFTGRSADKCHLHDKEYNLNDNIPDNFTEHACVGSCFCTKSRWEEFTCAQTECYEHLIGHPAPPCFRIFENENDCCSAKTLCHPVDEKLARCKFGNETYYEGQRFYDGCTVCICKPGFEGKIVEPFCRPVRCGVEIHDIKKARENCVPVYFDGPNKCCPLDWHCSSDTDIIVSAEKPSGIDKKCKYGNKELLVGDKVIPQRYSIYSPFVNCECRLPPMLTCLQTRKERPEPIPPIVPIPSKL